MDTIKIPRVFPARLEEAGLNCHDLLRHARLPQTLFDGDAILLSTRQFFALWKAIGDRSSDPAIGLRLGSDARVEQYDPVLITALTARTFREAVAKIARYKHLCCSEQMRITEDQGETCALTFTWLAEEEQEPTLLLDAASAAVVHIGRRGTGRKHGPVRVEWKRAPKHRALYEAHFGCPVVFGAERNALIYTQDALEESFVTHNPDLLAMLAPQLEAMHRESLAQKSLSEQVRVVQKRLLPGQRASIHDVAAELNMSPRTLQRHLASTGESYQKLLDETRHTMARHYLSESALDLIQIAYLLGYEETNSFHRAFQQWEGVSPGQWRSSTGHSVS